MDHILSLGSPMFFPTIKRNIGYPFNESSFNFRATVSRVLDHILLEISSAFRMSTFKSTSILKCLKLGSLPPPRILYSEWFWRIWVIAANFNKYRWPHILHSHCFVFTVFLFRFFRHSSIWRSRCTRAPWDLNPLKHRGHSCIWSVFPECITRSSKSIVLLPCLLHNSTWFNIFTLEWHSYKQDEHLNLPLDDPTSNSLQQTWFFFFVGLKNPFLHLSQYNSRGVFCVLYLRYVKSVKNDIKNENLNMAATNLFYNCSLKYCLCLYTHAVLTP